MLRPPRRRFTSQLKTMEGHLGASRMCVVARWSEGRTRVASSFPSSRNLLSCIMVISFMFFPMSQLLLEVFQIVRALVCLSWSATAVTSSRPFPLNSYQDASWRLH